MGVSRRTFFRRLAGLGGLAAGWPGLLSARRIIPWRNWSGAQQCLPAQRLAPADEDGVITAVREAVGVVRPVGSSHSFSALVPTDGTLLSLANLRGMISHDPASLQAEFWAGTTLAETGEPLQQVGQALPNLSDIDYQTLAGAMATATHGTGIRFQCLPGYVAGLRLVTADGEVMDCDAQNNPDVFAAARVSLGALGIITRYRLQNRPAFRLHTRQWVAPTEDLLAEMSALVDDNDHFELMPLIHSDMSIAIAHNETTAPLAPKSEPEGDTELANLMDSVFRHLREYPNLRASLINFVAGRLSFAEEVDDSYKVFANVRDVRFNEMEYSVPAANGPDCLREILAKIRDQNLTSWFPLEYRYVKGDDIPLSMFEGADRCAISVHQYYNMDHHNYFAAIEPIFWRHGGRPHWGKLHSLNAAHLAPLYPRWNEFAAVRQALDPGGKFLNAHLRSVLGVAA